MSDLQRDPETGKITGNKLSTERAQELARKRWSKPIEQNTEALILEAGYTAENVPTDFRLLCERAAQGDVRSILEYMKKTRPTDISLDLDANTCRYADSCILFTAYEGRANQDTIQDAKERLRDSRDNGK